MKIIFFILIMVTVSFAQLSSRIDTTSLSNRIDTKVSTTINSYTGNVTPTN